LADSSQQLALPSGVRRELRDRAASKLKELHTLVKAQGGGDGSGVGSAANGDPSMLGTDYPANEDDAAVADAASNAESIKRLEGKVDHLAKQMDYMVRSFNAAAGLSDS